MRGVWLVVVLVALVAASPSDKFDKNDAAQLEGALQTAVDKNNDVESTHYAVSTLTEFLKKDVKESAKACSRAQAVLDNKASSVADIHHAAAVTAALKCAKPLSADAKASVVTALTSKTVAGIHAGLGAAAAAKKAGVAEAATSAQIKEAVQDLVALGDDDGTFRRSESDEDSVGSVAETGLALEALSFAQTLGDFKSDVEGVNRKLGEAVALVFDDDEGASIESVSRFISGAGAAAKGAKASFAIDEEHLSKMADYLTKHKSASAPSDAYFLLKGLDAVVNNGFFTPLVITLESGTVVASAKGAEGQIKVAVTDVLGNFATAVKVFLVSAVGKSQGSTSLNNQELTAASSDSKNTIFNFNFLAAKPEAGFYVLELKADPVASGSKYIAAVGKRTVKVATSIAISDFELVVSDSAERSDLAEARSFKADFPNHIEEVSADQLQHIHVTLKVKNAASNRILHAQQAHLRFVNTATKEEVSFVGKTDEKRTTFHIDLNKVAQEFEHASGAYALHLTVGDAFIQNPVDWKVGTVNLAFGHVDYAANVDVFAAKPEIHHKFRTPEKRPAAQVSLVFTLVVLAPFAVLLVALLFSGANLDNFPSGAGALAALGFHGSIIAIALLYALYWLRLDMFQTLGYLSVLGLVGIFFGQRLLATISGRSKAHSE